MKMYPSIHLFSGEVILNLAYIFVALKLEKIVIYHTTSNIQYLLVLKTKVN